jgi:integrase/recombinase XerD
VEAMKRILDAVNEVGLTPPERYNLRGLILCQRWSGLSIIDALTLSRTKLYPDNSIELYRTKTGEVVITALPIEVAEQLRMLSNGHPGYFWWNGREKLDTIRQRYSEMLRLVFDAAGIDRNIDGMALSHRFRDTFAVEFLQAGQGGRLEDLSKLLGHSNIRTTEKHYAAWTKGRRDRLRNIAQESFQQQDRSMLDEDSPKQETVQ